MRPWCVVRNLGTAAVALVLTVSLVGCPEDATELVKPVGTALDFAVAPFVQGLPTGSVAIDRLTLAQFDPDRDPDAFGRGTGQFPFFSGTRYLIDAAARNVTNDPRVPALAGAGTEVVSPSLCRFGHSGFWFSATEPGFGWDFFCFLDGLQPNTDYTVMLVRYALTVNGELDTEEMLLTGTITNPDALTPLGGTPGGYPTELCDFDDTRPTYTVGVTGDQNPLVMGFTTTDANGSLVFDCLIGSGGFWQAGPQTLAVPDSAPLAPNAIGTFDLPRYNYVVIVEGTGTAVDPVPAGAHVMRFQVGVDIDASGVPINNGLAPLAAAAADTAALIAAPGGAGRPDSLTFVFQNLDALAGTARWQLWLANRDRSPVTFASASGTYERIQIIQELDPVTGEVVSQRDSVVETIPGTSTFVGQGGLFKHRMIVSDAGAGAADSVGLYTDAILTVELQPGGSTPSLARGLFFRYTNQAGTPDNYFDDVSTGGTLAFGSFDPANPSQARVLAPTNFAQAQGLGGILGSEVSVDVFNLPIPPVGYYYEGWLLGPGGDSISMGPLRAPPPDTVSLIDADVSQPHPVVVLGVGIRQANAFVSLSSPTDIVDCPTDPAQPCTVNLSTFFVTLEPKGSAATKGPTNLVAGAFPLERIQRRRGTQ